MLRHAFGKYQLGFISNAGCYLDGARDELVTEVLKYNPNYILWLDADQTYPGNTPEVLMNHIDSGKSVVGGVTPLKNEAIPELDGKPSVWDIDVETYLGNLREIVLNRGIIKVDGMGTGGMMTHPVVFKKMKYPWFRTSWNPKTKHRPSIDFQFYGNCKKAGIDVWCDTDLVFGHLALRPVSLKEKRGLIIV